MMHGQKNIKEKVE